MALPLEASGAERGCERDGMYSGRFRPFWMMHVRRERLRSMSCPLMKRNSLTGYTSTSFSVSGDTWGLILASTFWTTTRGSRACCSLTANPLTSGYAGAAFVDFHRGARSRASWLTSPRLLGTPRRRERSGVQNFGPCWMTDSPL